MTISHAPRNAPSIAPSIPRRNAHSNASQAMHGRTDGRTNGEVGYVSTTPHVPTRARLYGISTIGEVER